MAELVAGRLRRQIVQGELKEGDALPSESELLEHFDVSRTTLREAFRVLEAESLITIRRGAHGGARVQPPNSGVAARYAGLILQYRGATLADVHEARLLLEPPIIGLLASRRTEDDVARLRAALDEFDAAEEDPQLLIRSHAAIHALLIELAGNQTLRVLSGMVLQIAELADQEQAVATTAAHAAAGKRALKAYRRVVDLIEDGAQAGAEELWRKHLTEARDYLPRTDLTAVLELMR